MVCEKWCCANLNQHLLLPCKEHGIDIRITGGHAGWQQGSVEKHGGKFILTCHIKGTEQAKMALAMFMQPTRPTQTRCDVQCFWTAIKIVEDSYLLLALGCDGPSWLASRVRTAANIASRERDLQGKLRGALLRRLPTSKEMLFLDT